MLTNHHRKDLMIEAEFLPSSIEEAAAVRARILATLAAGDVDEVSPRYAESVADEITGWLIGKVQGVDGKSAPCRSRYRRILAAVQASPDGTRRRQAGFGTLSHLAGAGGLSLVGTGAATGSTMTASAGVVMLVVSIAQLDRTLLAKALRYVDLGDGRAVVWLAAGDAAALELDETAAA